MEKEQREFAIERFEFAIYANDNVICKRNFKINNFIDGSMATIDFKYTVDEIVRMIDDDLKSKSRIYTWYCYDEEDKEPNEFTEPLQEDWETTFKFVVTDNGREVISKIWDGKYYPKAIRERVDLSNKNVKIVTKDGRVYTIEKERYFRENEDRLSSEMYIVRQMMADRKDLLLAITKKICSVCSPREGGYHNIGDYTTSEWWCNKNVESVDENGLVKSAEEADNKVKYSYSMDTINNKVSSQWAKVLSEKTKEYRKSLYF